MLKRQAAGDQASTLAAKAVDGVIVERVDGLERDTLRDIALALRDKDGLRAVVLGHGARGRRRGAGRGRHPGQRPQRVRPARGGQEAHQGRRRQGSAARGGRRQGRRGHRRGPRERAGGGGHRRLVRALGLDLGSQRIGVALSTSDGSMATPYEVVARTRRSGPRPCARSPRWPTTTGAERARGGAPAVARRLGRARRHGRPAEAEELGDGHRPPGRALGRAAHHRHGRSRPRWPSTSTPRPAAGLSTRWPRRSCCRRGSTTVAGPHPRGS